MDWPPTSLVTRDLCHQADEGRQARLVDSTTKAKTTQRQFETTSRGPAVQEAMSHNCQQSTQLAAAGPQGDCATGRRDWQSELLSHA